MDILFQDPDEIPLPKDEVRIRVLNADPWHDGQRVRVTVELDPFLVRPNLDLAIIASNGDELASVSIIESMTRKMELTMHLRGAVKGDRCQLAATLYYLQEIDQLREPVPAQDESIIVDRVSAEFSLDDVSLDDGGD